MEVVGGFIMEIILIVILSVIGTLFLDNLLFKIWHRGAHSSQLREEEKELKKKEAIAEQERIREYHGDNLQL